MNIIENLYFILWVAGFVAFLIFFFHEHYKYKKFVDKLKPGVALQVTKYLINDEFDPWTYFHHYHHSERCKSGEGTVFRRFG